MITVNSGKIMIPRTERFVGFAGDNLHKTVQFFVTPAAQNCTYNLILSFSDNSVRIIPLSATSAEEGVTLTWEVRARHIPVPGLAWAQIKVESGDSDTEYYTGKNFFIIGDPDDRADSSADPDASFADRVLASLSGKLPYIGNDGYWYVYSSDTGDYVKRVKADSEAYTRSQADALLAQKADVSDIPTNLSELSNDSGFIPTYLAESAPPSGNTESFYAVPCVWMYNDKFWLVWARNTVSIPGQPAQYYYSFKQLETIIAGSSSLSSPDYDGQLGWLAAYGALCYGLSGSWRYIADQSYVKKYAQHTMSCTLSAASWSNLTQTLDISSSYTVTAKTKVDIQIDGAVYSALASAGCKGLYVENSSGSLTVRAIGAAPASDVTVQLCVTEVITS